MSSFNTLISIANLVNWAVHVCDLITYHISLNNRKLSANDLLSTSEVSTVLYLLIFRHICCSGFSVLRHQTYVHSMLEAVTPPPRHPEYQLIMDRHPEY